MKERPILFSPPMVRALLAGTKTQTRRSMKVQPATRPDLGLFSKTKFGATWVTGTGAHDIECLKCPYGQPGDRIWVREIHAETDLCDGTPVVAYAADDSQIAIGRVALDGSDYIIPAFRFKEDVAVDKWMPSIFMPRWASRITLEIVSVRVERVTDISDADAEAEGYLAGDFEYHHNAEGTETAKESYECLWGSINGAGAWAENPWVWVVEFKKVTA